MSPFDAGSPVVRRAAVPKNPSRLREVTNNEHVDEFVVAADPAATIPHSTPFAPVTGEYAAYADAVASTSDVDILEDSGLLARLYAISAARVNHYELPASNVKEEEITAAHLECRTWDLVQRLYLERTKDIGTIPRVSSHVSNHSLVQHLYNTNNAAAESKIVLDWLHDGDVVQFDLDLRSNRWFFTRELIKSKKRADLGNQEQKIVDSLDPDAPLRQGKRLAEEDQEYERNLIRAMFFCVRAGNYRQAADLARQSGEFWRAASLQGCVEHFDPQLDGIVDDAMQPEGTVQKPLWRRMCFALSQQASFDKFERALYGALCGDINSVLPVLSTWEDCLWVNYNAMNQSAIESHLRSLGRGLLSHEFAISDYSHLSPQSILDSLLQSNDEYIRTEARTPLRVVQARLITNQVEILLTDVHEQLQGVQKGKPGTVATSPEIIKFVVHLILVLRRISIPLPEEASNVIIQAYVELLILSEHDTAIALYAAQLPPSEAVEALARYFMVVEEEDDRRTQLEAAQRYGIDTKVTILRAIELVFEKVLCDFALGQGTRDVNAEVEADEERCVRALEWLNLDETLNVEAVMLGNNLFRKLLLAGRTSAAKTLAMRMPDTRLIPVGLLLNEDSEHQVELVDAQMRDAIEYVGFCTLVKALSKYEDWKSLIRARPQEINGRRDPVGLRQWKNDVARLRTECLIVMKEVITSNWCDATELGVTDPIIVEEMFNLRNMYVPDVVLKLHGVLSAHEGRDVAAVMELAVQVSEQLTMPMKRSGLLPTYVSEVALLGAYLA